MRKLFSRQLIEARHEMLSIYEAVDLALHDAVKAYVTDDRKLATKTKKRTLSIDARCANLEAVCYNLIATQSPVLERGCCGAPFLTRWCWEVLLWRSANNTNESNGWTAWRTSCSVIRQW